MPDPDRESRIALGISKVMQGMPMLTAAEEVDIPRTTLLRRYQQLLGPDAPNRDEERKRADERILATAYAAAERGLFRILGEMDNADRKELVGLTALASNTIARLRGWDAKNKNTDDTGNVGRLTQLLGSLSENNLEATLSIKRAEPQQAGHVLLEDGDDGGE